MVQEQRPWQVKINGDDGPCLSSIQHLTRSVPQGSLMGPILFLIMFNDLPPLLDGVGSLVINFADDTNFLIRGGSLEECVASLQSKYAILTDWISSNELKLNETKTKLLLFRSHRKGASHQSWSNRCGGCDFG